MAKMTNDFRQIVQQMAQQRVSDAGQRPVVRAGIVAENELAGWLGDLSWDGLQVCIWIRADACTIDAERTPGDPRLLEGARLFGAGGDLELWLTGDGFGWRFVGKQGIAPIGEDLLWPGDDINPVYCQPRKALLWGKREEGETQWFDDRVAGAQLTYPGIDKRGRVQICYDAYTQAGHVQFVWLKKLEAYNG